MACTKNQFVEFVELYSYLLIRLFLFILLVSCIVSCEKDPFGDGLYHGFGGKFAYTDIQSIDQVYTLNSARTKQITFSSIDKRYAEWHPDRIHIFFISYDENGVAINVIDENGKNEKKLKHINPTPNGVVYITNLHLSPDGNMLAVAGQDSVILFSVDQNVEFLTYKSTFHCKTNYKYLVWAPDSKKLSCACPGADSTRHLMVYDVMNEQFNDFTPNLGHSVRDQSWSYNNQQIAFISSSDIYLINSDGTDLKIIVNSSEFFEEGLVFSPYDNRLVYERADTLFDLVMYDIETQTTEVLVDDAPDISGPLIWIEEGRFILYGYGYKTFDLDEYRLYEIETKENHTIIEGKVLGLNWIQD